MPIDSTTLRDVVTPFLLFNNVTDTGGYPFCEPLFSLELTRQLHAFLGYLLDYHFFNFM